MKTVILRKEESADSSLSALVSQFSESGHSVVQAPLFGETPDYSAILDEIETAEHVICWK